MPKDRIRRIDAKNKEIKVETMVTTIERVNMFEMGTTIATTTSTGVIMVIGMTVLGPIFPHKIAKLLLGTVEVVWPELKI